MHTRSEDSGSDDEAEPPKIARTLDLHSPTAAQPAVQAVPTLESVAEGHARSVQLPAVAPMAPGQPPSQGSLVAGQPLLAACHRPLPPRGLPHGPRPLAGIPSVTHGNALPFTASRPVGGPGAPRGPAPVTAPRASQPVQVVSAAADVTTRSFVHDNIDGVYHNLFPSLGKVYSDIVIRHHVRQPSDEYYVIAKGDPDTRPLSNALNILLMKMHVLATKKGLNDSLTAVAEQVAAGAGFATKGLEKALLTYDAYAYSIAKCLYDHFEADVPEDRRASVRYILPSSILQNRVNNANTAHNVSER